jgi:uncharacterized protein
MINILISSFVAYFTASLTKIILRLKKEKKIDLQLFYKAGGMPSGHSASVSALILSVFFSEGFSSLFAITLVFSLIVLRDTMLRKKGLKHSLIEVTTGVFVGIISAYLVHLFL